MDYVDITSSDPPKTTGWFPPNVTYPCGSPSSEVPTSLDIVCASSQEKSSECQDYCRRINSLSGNTTETILLLHNMGKEFSGQPPEGAPVSFMPNCQFSWKYDEEPFNCWVETVTERGPCFYSSEAE